MGRASAVKLIRNWSWYCIRHSVCCAGAHAVCCTAVVCSRHFQKQQLFSVAWRKWTEIFILSVAAVTRSAFTSSKHDTVNPNWFRVGLAFASSGILWGLVMILIISFISVINSTIWNYQELSNMVMIIWPHLPLFHSHLFLLSLSLCLSSSFSANTVGTCRSTKLSMASNNISHECKSPIRHLLYSTV